jgi:hypothetical protein
MVRFRYSWPSELDLMARMAGLRLKERACGWGGDPFTGPSPSHVGPRASGGLIVSSAGLPGSR